MLKKISQILFIFLLSSLIIFFILLWLNNEIKIDYKIIYLFWLILIPFWEPLIQSIKSEENYFYKFSKISFIFALIGLIWTAIFLIIWDKKIAENLSIYSYYFLIIWVLIEIWGNIFFKEANNKKEKIIEKKSGNLIVNFIKDEIKAHWLDDKVNNFIINIFSKNKIDNIKNKIWILFSEKYSQIHNNEKNKNFLLVIKIIWIILIYKLVEKNWEYFTVENLIYLLLLLIILFLSKDFIFSSIKNIFSKTKNTENNINMPTVGFSPLYKNFFTFYKKNIKKINYFLYIINSILVVLILKYDLLFILDKTIIIFILSYIYSLFLNKEYLNNINLKEIVTKNYFFNKAVVFSSVWTVVWYLILSIFKINNTFILENQIIVFLIIFLLFFTVFYLIFHTTNKRELLQNKTSLLLKIFIEKNINAWRKVKNFSPTKFIKNNIYTSLNIILVITILITFWIKNNFFKEFYNDHINNIKAINFLVLEDKKVIYKTPKKDLIEQVKKTLVSWEVKIKNKEVENNNIVEIKETIKVIKYYKFKQALSESKNKNIEVKKLEEIMKKLWYFTEEPDFIFNKKTKISLIELLKKECDWPETTKWILGYRAQLCLYWLDIEK